MPQESEEERLACRGRYLSLQIIHKNMMPVFSIIFSCVVIIWELLLIASLFCSITLYNAMDNPIFMDMALRVILGIVFLNLYLNYCGNIYATSKNYLELCLQQNGNGTMLEWEKYYYKACRPLSFTIGQFSTIKKLTYLVVLSDIILAKLCDLLIAYKVT